MTAAIRWAWTCRPAPVLVVGGGPAGMEAARVLAERGHRVRLAERGPALGGMLATAAAGPRPAAAGRGAWKPAAPGAGTGWT